MATVLKHPGFKNEAEWRLILRWRATDLGPLEFRIGRSVLVPFLTVYLGELIDLGETTFIVVCGPTPEGALSENSAINVFGIHGWRNYVVERSKMPYRDW